MSELYESKSSSILDDPHFALPTKLPIIFLLILTSFPAGFMPFVSAGAYKEMKQEQQITTRWRNERQIESTKRLIRSALWTSLAAITAHLCIIALAFKRWDEKLLGLRGSIFLVLAWGVFSFGITAGIWVWTIMPK